MAQVRPEALGGLLAAAAREKEAARGLCEALRKHLAAMESLDPRRMEGALSEARRRAEGLSVAFNAMSSLTRLAARASGLGESATLQEIGARAGEGDGALLAAEAQELSGVLKELAVEVAAQGVAAKHGAGVWAHLVGLGGDSSRYNAVGLLRHGSGTLSHRA